MLPDQIKVNWRVRPISKDPDQEGKDMDWYNNLKKTYGKTIAYINLRYQTYSNN